MDFRPKCRITTRGAVGAVGAGAVDPLEEGEASAMGEAVSSLALPVRTKVIQE